MTSNPQVTIQIVGWNSLTHFPSCLEAVAKQTYHPIKVLVIDNASVDQTVTWFEEHYPQYHLLRNTRNTGFCHAHNQGFRINRTPYALVLNPDVVLSEDWIARAVAFLESHPEYGSYGGKIRRYSYTIDELKSVAISDIIDSTGLQVHRSRHTVDRGSGQVDRGQFEQAQDVFGHSGACTLYRMTALETIRYQDEFFDEDFFAYKDDVDTAWRLQRMGWKSWYDPAAVAYHHREIKGRDTHTSLGIVQTHQRRQRWVTEISYRNHLYLLAKNETTSTFWRDFPWIAWYECKKFGFLLMTQPRSLRAWPEFLRGLAKQQRKGQLLRRRERVTAMQVRKWFL